MSNAIDVDDSCMESYPCQHYVSIDGASMGTWYGTEIYKWYVDHGQKVPDHFALYGPNIKDK